MSVKSSEYLPSKEEIEAAFKDNSSRSSMEHLSVPFPSPIESAVNMCGSELPSPNELISGLLHQGTKFALGGGSKTCKTWVLLDMAICVSAGIPLVPTRNLPRQQSPVRKPSEIHPVFFRTHASSKSLRRTRNSSPAKPKHLELTRLPRFPADILLPQITRHVKSDQIQPPNPGPNLQNLRRSQGECRRGYVPSHEPLRTCRLRNQRRHRFCCPFLQR